MSDDDEQRQRRDRASRDAMQWTPEAQARAADTLKKLRAGELRMFYCTERGKCGGKPHGGYPYPHARADQYPPPGVDWRIWAEVGGRGSGKTKTGSEYTLKVSDKAPRIGLVGRTQADVIDVMVDGESGILACARQKGIEVDYQRSRARLVFPSGAVATLFSAEKPQKLRGPQHNYMWFDEPAHYDDIDEMWLQGMLGLRLPGKLRPHALVTTTPLPTKWMKALLADPKTRAVRVSTFANAANLSEDYLEDIRKKHEGTRMGRQELYGEVLTDVEGALWNDQLFTHVAKQRPRYDRSVVAIDPAGTANRRSDETGIISVGRLDDEFDVIRDRSGKLSPTQWADRAIAEYERISADAIVVESNFGGDMVKTTIENEAKRWGTAVRVVVRRAMKSKQLRAEPVVGLYEQSRVNHVQEHGLAELEEEQLEWVPGKGDSPNRIDALVWGITELDGTIGFGRASSPASFRGGGPGGPGGLPIPGMMSIGNGLPLFARGRR